MALIGTPVENRLSELWSIMEFLNPGYLGPGEQFRRNFAIPIEKYRDAKGAARSSGHWPLVVCPLVPRQP